jgi:hypothetical protein
MATSKSTVLGIRLDHDRRAWLEAEAARRGVSVRVLFEGMIDGARSGETANVAPGVAGLGSATPNPVTVEAPAEGITAAPSNRDASTPGVSERVNTSSGSSSSASPGSSPWPELGSVTALPAGLVRGAFSLTANLIEASGRCASRRLGRCVCMRHWAERS